MFLTIEELGGQYPMQAEGTINGRPFYFRARGSGWRIGVGGDPVMNPAWSYSQDYGEWPDAGYMEPWEAVHFIGVALAIYLKESQDQTSDEPT